METVAWMIITLERECVYISNRIWTTTYADALVLIVRKKERRITFADFSH